MQFLNTVFDALNHYKDFTKSVQDLKEVLSTDLIWLLQRAMLAGEYYDRDKEKCSDKIKEIENTISDLTKTRLANIGKAERNEIDEVISTFTNYLNTFRILSINLANRIESITKGKDGYILDINQLLTENSILQIIEATSPTNIDSTSLHLKLAFKVNIYLAYIDEHLVCTDGLLNSLERTGDFLKGLLKNRFNQEVIESLIDKNDFLIFKIKYRNQHSSKENPIKSRTILSLQNQNRYYKLYEKVLIHFSQLLQSQKYYDEEKGLDSTNVKTFVAEPFHHLNRFYKKTTELDNSGRLKFFTKLKSKIDEYKLESFSTFDKVAFTSVDKLVSNSKLDIDLKIEEDNKYSQITAHFQKYILDEEKSVEPEFIINILEEVEKIADEDHFPDYFCFIILIKFLNAFVDFLIKTPRQLLIPRVLEIDEAKLEKKLDAIYEFINKLYKGQISAVSNTLDVMMSHEVKPIYMTQKECIIPFEWLPLPIEEELDSIINSPNYEVSDKKLLFTGIQSNKVPGELFLRSSYILPINFEKQKAKITTWDEFSVPQLNHLKESLAISINKSITNKTLNTYEKKIKENELKTVQIIAMFVSIATFVLINVKIFDNKTTLESLGIIIGLAACFFLFNYFFHLIIVLQTDSNATLKKIFKRSALFAITPLIFLIFSWLIIYYQKDAPKAFKDIDEKFKKDSILLDSLRKVDQQLIQQNIDNKTATSILKAIQDSIIIQRNKSK